MESSIRVVGGDNYKLPHLKEIQRHRVGKPVHAENHDDIAHNVADNIVKDLCTGA